MQIMLLSTMAQLVREAIEKILDLAGISFKSMAKKDDKLYSIEEVFPDHHIGHALRGFRLREGLTQKQVAEFVGARTSHISEMENGKRPIGKGMAFYSDVAFCRFRVPFDLFKSELVA